uniref:Uncharacterized protein n=1 Tax=Panagrolaimus davidi TaxID=227884 RepID=A0A914P7N4_9BILA
MVRLFVFICVIAFIVFSSEAFLHPPRPFLDGTCGNPRAPNPDDKDGCSDTNDECYDRNYFTQRCKELCPTPSDPDTPTVCPPEGLAVACTTAPGCSNCTIVACLCPPTPPS